MFEALSSIFSKKEKKYKVLMIGPFQTGRTTILYKQKCGELINPVPTMGFNFEQIQIKAKVQKRLKFPKKFEAAPGQQKKLQYTQKIINTTQKVKFGVYDIGGADKMRALFPYYYSELDVLLYVIDAEMIYDDKYKMQIAKEDIKNLLSNQNLSAETPILFLINKIDLLQTGKLPELTKVDANFTKEEMLERMQKIIDHEKIKNRIYEIKFCSVHSQESLDQVFSWVGSMCLRDKQ